MNYGIYLSENKTKYFFFGKLKNFSEYFKSHEVLFEIPYAR